MSTGLSQELEDGLDFGDDEGEELTIEEAEEGARAFDAAQVHQQHRTNNTAPTKPHTPNDLNACVIGGRNGGSGNDGDRRFGRYGGHQDAPRQEGKGKITTFSTTPHTAPSPHCVAPLAAAFVDGKPEVRYRL